MEEINDGAKVRFPPPLVYAGGLALGLFAGRIWHLPSLTSTSGLRVGIGFVLVMLGLGASIMAVGLFRRSNTAIIPYKPASLLVTQGIYRMTRNPMYLGLALLYAGVAVLLNSLISLVLLVGVIAIIQFTVIRREEAYLNRAFGAEYQAYTKRVRRWL